MSLINFEINLMLTWPENIVIWYNAATEKETIFVMTDTKLYLPFVTLSTQYNAKLSQQLKSRFKSIIIWKKYQSKLSTQTWNQYLDYFIDPSFQAVNRLFVLSFKNNAD